MSKEINLSCIYEQDYPGVKTVFMEFKNTIPADWEFSINGVRVSGVQDIPSHHELRIFIRISDRTTSHINQTQGNE